MATHTYTIFLLKLGLNTIADAIDDDKNPTEHPIAGMDGLTGSLFLGDQHRSTPEWVGMIQPFLTVPIPAVISASISAVLIVNHGGRSFAIVFGHGKSLLRATARERGFGLKVTLNRVDPDGLRSIDSKTYEDLVVSTRRQTSRISSLNTFELDVSRALVRGVAGNAAGTTVFKRFVGSDALRVTTDLSFSQLPQLLAELLLAYNSTHYRANFGWVDNIREVDPAKHVVLDTQLVADLRSTAGTDAHLAPADIVSWDEIEEFNYTGGSRSENSPDLSLPVYLGINARRGVMTTLEKLKTHRVKVRYVNDTTFRDEWSLYDCLVWETRFQNNRYLLFDGRWFEVSASYATRVDGYVSRISTVTAPVLLPNANPGQKEGAYNVGVQTGNPGVFALLDLQTFRPTGGASPIEFCDLITDSREVIHVKKRSSSATLSHLFSQGSVSADLFLNDQTLRTSVRRKLTTLGKASHAALIPVGRPNPSDFEIVYAVIAKPTRGQWPPSLPFFSAVNLMHHGSRIEGLGYRLSLQYIRQL